MMHASNTPPDGDFARYVEGLAGTKALPAVREDLFMPKDGGPVSASFAASSGQPSANTAPPALRGMSFFTHVKWVVALWIATQAFAKMVPAASLLFIPALLVYAVWVILRVSRDAVGGAEAPAANPMVVRLSEIARRAAEKAKTAQQFQSSQPPQHKNKP